MPDIGTCAGGICLRAWDHQPDAGRDRPHVLDVDRHQFGTPQRAGEADEQQRPIPGTGKIVAAYPDQSLDLRSGQGG